MKKYTQNKLDKVAEGGSLAEEIVSSVRTTQAFGTQKDVRISCPLTSYNGTLVT